MGNITIYQAVHFVVVARYHKIELVLPSDCRDDGRHSMNWMGGNYKSFETIFGEQHFFFLFILFIHIIPYTQYLTITVIWTWDKNVI